MELNTGKFFTFQTGKCFNLWGTLWDYVLLLSDWGFGKGGRNCTFPFGNKTSSLQASNKKKTDLSPITFELSCVPTWRWFLVFLHNVTCHAAMGFSTSIQLLHTCECPQCPRAWAGNRVAVHGFCCCCCFSCNLSLFSLPVLMCYTLSNFADVVVWTSVLWGKCNLFTPLFTLNCRFMSPCEIFSGLLS